MRNDDADKDRVNPFAGQSQNLSRGGRKKSIEEKKKDEESLLERINQQKSISCIDLCIELFLELFQLSLKIHIEVEKHEFTYPRP